MSHDEIYVQLCKELKGFADVALRPIGVKDNLFRLSGYLSDKAQVPDRETLTFLHAYIFALENHNYYQREEIKRLHKTQMPTFLHNLRPPRKKRQPRKGQ